MPVLHLDALSRHFGGLNVIEDLSLELWSGEVLGILGPNGAGKSTLFNLIAGVLPPSAGTVRFEGRSISGLRSWSRCRAGISRTYQIPKPFGNMTVFENVLVGAVHGRGLSRRDARRHAGEVLEMTGLAHRADALAGTLSLLDLKRLELAKALGQKPRLLLMDEIAGGLTDAECGDLLAIVRKVREGGVTIVWIEHVLHALRQMATRLAVLYGGRFIAEGDPDAVMADPRVAEVYIGK